MYYYYNYQDAGYPGEPLPDNGGSFPGIFHIVINQSSQTNILFKITNHVLFREAIMQEKCSFFNIVQTWGGGQSHVKKLCCKFCIIQRALWQHKLRHRKTALFLHDGFPNNIYVMVNRRPSYWTACHPCPWAVGLEDDDDDKSENEQQSILKSFDDERGRWEWTED